MKHKLLTPLAAACIALAGCASQPATRFHSLLSTQDGGAPQSLAAGAAAGPLDLAAVRLPAAVDQQPWVVRMPDDSLRILELEQWVAPLRDELRAAVFDRLARRHGALDARAAPAAEPLRLTLDVQRFESIAAREAWLDVIWSAQGAGAQAAAPLVCRSSLREPVHGDAAGIAAAHRRAVTRLADAIGPVLVALRSGAAPRCP